MGLSQILPEARGTELTHCLNGGGEREIPGDKKKTMHIARV